MQAKLPDVNNALATHRVAVLSNNRRKNYPGVILHVRAMIALLPEDYRVEIDSKSYYEELATIRMIKCDFCFSDKEEYVPIPLSTIKITHRLNNSFQELELNSKYSDIWSCPYCSEENLLSKSEFYLSNPEDPFYVKIIPSPPKYTSFRSRLGYDEQFAKWLEISFAEIENQIQLYRTEYVKQNPDESTDISPDMLDEVEGVPSG